MGAIQRVAAAYDWDLVVMGDLLVGLEHRRRAGELTNEQEQRYRQLKAALDAALPTIDRLGLARPQEAPR